MLPQVFREYDIRGVVDKEIHGAGVLLLGRAFGTYMARQGKRRLAVGRDCRTSSDGFRDLLLEGLTAAGMDVVDIGVCPTPLLYFALRRLEAEGGIMITASHNPSEYNGFKICNGFDTIYGAEILKLREIMESGDLVSGTGSVRSYDIVAPYIDYVAGNIAIGRKLRVGVDAGNATGGPIALPVLDRLGCEVHPIFCDVDARFPNHDPDPTVLENLDALSDLVRRERLDVGIAYDGDCDRLGVVDHNGEPVFGDKLMVIFAREILTRKPGSTFISEVKCSTTLYEDIERRGGQALMWRTGHSLIKAKMHETGAELAGEMSGHMFFKDRFFGFDDGIYASCRLLEVLADTGKTIPELLEGIPITATTPEIRVPCPDEIKFDLVEKVKRHFMDNGYKIIDIDGVRVVFPDGWGLLRASNTQPILVLRYEACTPERLDDIRGIMEGVLDRLKP